MVKVKSCQVGVGRGSSAAFFIWACIHSRGQLSPSRIQLVSVDVVRNTVQGARLAVMANPRRLLSVVDPPRKLCENPFQKLILADLSVPPMRFCKRKRCDHAKTISRQ